MINNANKKSLSQTSSALPQVDPAVAEFLQNMSFGIVQKTMVDGYIQEVVITKKCLATKQAMNPTELAMKPEGQRTWNWSKIHSIDLDVPLDSVFILDTLCYRVLSRIENGEYGFFEYDVKEDYSGPLPSAGDFSRPY